MKLMENAVLLMWQNWCKEIFLHCIILSYFFHICLEFILNSLLSLFMSTMIIKVVYPSDALSGKDNDKAIE